MSRRQSCCLPWMPSTVTPFQLRTTPSDSEGSDTYVSMYFYRYLGQEASLEGVTDCCQ